MTKEPAQVQSEIGVIGLGVMGRSFMLNLADHGYSVAGFDSDLSKVAAMRADLEGHAIYGAVNIEEFTLMLRKPRAVMLLVPAGPPVDAVIKDLYPCLERGDLIIDAGNSHFKDTNLRARHLNEKGVQLLGVGLSGGEEGARHGPSIMAGGAPEAYERVREIFEAVAARVNGDSCAARLGPGSAGHFVKMVHNGIEYGLLQLIAESYDLMKRGVGLNDEEMAETYSAWNRGALKSYLIEITGQIFRKVDEKTGHRLIDEILDVAKQKGTGMWTSQSALDLQVPLFTIDVAVGFRDLSLLEGQRERASELLQRPRRPFDGDREKYLAQLGQALQVGMLLTFAQGFAVLTAGSERYKYHLELETVARIWRGGCIIRAELLEDLRAACGRQPGLPNLLLDPKLAERVLAHQEALRRVVCSAAELGVPAPALMTALSYLDGYRSKWLPTSLIQAQRDYFGAHTYERVDAKGIFHTQWEKG